PEEPRTVHRDACAGPTSYCEPSRVRETTRLLLVPPPAPLRTPPEQFVAELEAWRDSLDPKLREQLFPTQGSASPASADSPVPLHLLVTLPGAPGTPSSSPVSLDIQPRTTGTQVASPLVNTQFITRPG